MRFRSPKRREPQLGELLLQWTHVVVAQCDVMREVTRAFKIAWVDAVNSRFKGALGLGERQPVLA